jgi:transposase
VIDVVAELDMSSFLTAYGLDGRGGAAYDPQMMLTLLVYSYCVGERSSRRIERRLVEDVGLAPDLGHRACLITRLPRG